VSESSLFSSKCNSPKRKFRSIDRSPEGKIPQTKEDRISRSESDSVHKNRFDEDALI
jgi:hypothetical protein